MPSLISQMRNGQVPQQPMAQAQIPSQAPIDENYLNTLKIIMRSNNSQQLLDNLAAQNPQVKQLLQMARNGGNLQQLGEMIARQKNIDPNWLINKLMS